MRPVAATLRGIHVHVPDACEPRGLAERRFRQIDTIRTIAQVIAPDGDNGLLTYQGAINLGLGLCKLWISRVNGSHSAKALPKCANESNGSNDNTSGSPVTESDRIQELGTYKFAQARAAAASALPLSVVLSN
jgi:hypothetical protein